MQINNNYNEYNPQTKHKSQSEPTMDEKLEKFKTKLIPNVTMGLKEMAERRMPENGPFTSFCVAFNIPTSSQNEGYIQISHNPKEKDKRILSTNVHHRNSDRIFSNIIMQGSKKEIMEFLSKSENHKIFEDSLLELSTKVDEYYASL